MYLLVLICFWPFRDLGYLAGRRGGREEKGKGGTATVVNDKKRFFSFSVFFF